MTKHTTHESTNEIPYGYCHCGCGQKTTISKYNDKSHGYVRGEPRKFIRYHWIVYGSLDEAFWSRIVKGARGECWEWQGVVDTSGYGQFPYQRKQRLAHRVSWELHNGPIPEGLHCLHKCDNRLCCNPSHLFLGTPADNNKDRDNKGRHIALNGENHGMVKLTEIDVIEIRRLNKEGMSQRSIARLYGVSKGNIAFIVHRQTWKHIP